MCVHCVHVCNVCFLKTCFEVILTIAAGALDSSLSWELQLVAVQDTSLDNSEGELVPEVSHSAFRCCVLEALVSCRLVISAGIGR